jgi:hypothetical protein
LSVNQEIDVKVGNLTTFQYRNREDLMGTICLKFKFEQSFYEVQIEISESHSEMRLLNSSLDTQYNSAIPLKIYSEDCEPLRMLKKFHNDFYKIPCDNSNINYSAKSIYFMGPILKDDKSKINALEVLSEVILDFKKPSEVRSVTKNIFQSILKSVNLADKSIKSEYIHLLYDDTKPSLQAKVFAWLKSVSLEPSNIHSFWLDSISQIDPTSLEIDITSVPTEKMDIVIEKL